MNIGTKTMQMQSVATKAGAAICCAQLRSRATALVRTRSAVCRTSRLIITSPAITLPAGFSKTGLPIGFQIVGRPNGEFELLSLLMENTGRLLTRDVLIDRVWGADYVGDTKTLDVHIKRLRSHVEEDPSSPKLITTIRGVGYRFDAPRDSN